MTRNARFSVSGYGVLSAYCEGAEEGIQVIPGQEAQTRTGRVWYPKIVKDGNFSVSVTHPTYDEFVYFNNWMKVYLEQVAAGSLGPMRVTIPSRKIDKVAIPSDGIRFGREAQEFIWKQNIEFTATSEVLDLTDVSDLTQISNAYLSTYYETGGSPGDYQSNYAIASLGDILFPTRSEGIYDRVSNFLNRR